MRARWLDTGPRDAAFNMALDEALFEGALARPTLRVYAWSPPAVSLGRFQSPDDVPPTAIGYPVVRRMTGGGAILHEDELTFSAALPSVRDAAGGIEASYRLVHAGVAAALADLGVSVDGDAAATADGAGAPFLCYERRASFDLCVGGRKLVGSAQRRGGGRVLQHGSVPLGPRAQGPLATTASLCAGRRIAYEELAERLRKRLGEALGLTLVSGALTIEERMRVDELVAARYPVHTPEATAGAG